MATRTVYTSTALSVLTSANFEKMPKGWLGYITRDTAQTGITTTPVDLTGLTLTVDVPASRILRITASVPFESDTADDRLTLNINEGATLLGSAQISNGVANVPYVLNTHALVVAPSAGSHTYKLVSGLGAGSTGPAATDYTGGRVAFLLIEDVGPSS